jgi:hypothetical protein
VPRFLYLFRMGRDQGEKRCRGSTGTGSEIDLQQNISQPSCSWSRLTVCSLLCVFPVFCRALTLLLDFNKLFDVIPSLSLSILSIYGVGEH